jgi:hypothetical protein
VIDTETDEDDTGTDPGKTNIGKVMSGKNQGRLKTILDAITDFFNDISGTDENSSSQGAKKNMEYVATKSRTALYNSLEGKIARVQAALSEKLGLKYPDGSERDVWVVMTLLDKVIWQNPVDEKYFVTEYTLDGENVILGESDEVEQAYVLKEANSIFTNMTAKDLDAITRRNKMNESDETIEKSVHDAALAEKDEMIAQLQKEFAELKTAQEEAKKNKEDANWAKLKAEVIPKGLVKEEADEMDLRKLSKEDPLAFNLKIQEYRATDQFKEEGESHVSGPDKEVREQKEIDMVLEKDRGRNIPGRLH